MDEKSQTEPQQSFLERLKGRSLSDIRIHSDGLAGDLTRRLGARAFTVGRDIYVKPELLETMTPEGDAIIAHELTHVAEQTGRQPSDFPLLRPQQTSSSSSHGTGSVTVQRAIGASVSSSEAGAGRAESSARQSSQSSGAQGSRQDAMDTAPPPDAEELADRVYVLMVQDLILDSERGAQHR